MEGQLTAVIQDLRHAGRVFVRHPGYLATALLTLALGIGFTTTMFSVAYAVLLKPLPYHEPSGLVRLIERNLPRFPQFSVSPGHYLFWRDHAAAFEGLGAWATNSVNLELSARDPERVRADRVTANLFPLLGVHPVIGRGFEDRDDRDGAARVALLSFGAWQRRFGGQADAVGQVVRMDRQPVTIVGVMPDGFAFPSAETEMWVPAAFSQAERRSYGSHYMSAIGRLKPGVTLDEAVADMKLVSARLIAAHPGSAGWEVLLFDMRDHMVGGVRRALYVLLGAVALVLLIACANVANLLLVRGAARQRELAIRTAIGATRLRLIRHLLMEQVALAAMSGAAGILVAAWMLRVLLAMVPAALPRQMEIALDGRVLVFAVAISSLTLLLFGLFPAIQGSRPDLRGVLAAGGRQGGGVPGRRLRTGLVVAETALATMLLVGAGLLLRSFAKLVDEPPGFTADRALVAGVSLPADKYPSGEPRERFFGEFLGRLRSLPQVAAAGIAMPMPMITDFNSWMEIEGEPPSPDGRPLTLFYAVSDGYFDAMGIPLLKGRYVTADDRRGGHRVIVINQALADRYFRGADPIGRRMRVGQGNEDWREIVGIVGNVKQHSLADGDAAQVYESYLQHPYFAGFSLVVRTNTEDAAAVVPDVRAVLRSLDPELPLAQVRTLEQLVGRSVRPQRFSATLIGLFGAAALLLAGIGVYSVMAHTTALRTQEFAIRIAHGATRSDILALVLRDALSMSVAGILGGFAVAALQRRIVEGLLFGVTAADPTTYLAALGILLLVGIAASAVPAIRATRVDPIVALRTE
jgi:putative ABC transport system permease protein